MANFAPECTQLFKGGNHIAVKIDDKVALLKKPVAYEDLPEYEMPEHCMNLVSGLATVFKLRMLDKSTKIMCIFSQELFQCSSLYPVPESTRKTGQVPVEYFKLLQAIVRSVTAS
jgi:hypothetical protein